MKGRLREVLLYALLAFGAFTGARMDPKEIEELQDVMNRTRIEVTIEAEKDKPQLPKVPELHSMD